MASSRSRNTSRDRTKAAGKPKGRLGRLQSSLAAVGEVREKRTRQLERARSSDAAGKRAAKRARQLEKAERRAGAILAKIAGLSAATDTPATAAGTAPGPSAYCLSERRMIQMRDAHPFVMRNGRLATAGVCPSCGKRVTRAG